MFINGCKCQSPLSTKHINQYAGDYVSKVTFQWTFNVVMTSKLIFMSSGTLLTDQLSYVLRLNML